MMRATIASALLLLAVVTFSAISHDVQWVPAPTPVPTSTVRLAPTPDPAPTNHLRQYMQGFAGTEWYSHVHDVWVQDRRVYVRADAVPYDPTIRPLCIALNGYVFASNSTAGLTSWALVDDAGAAVLTRSTAAQAC